MNRWWPVTRDWWNTFFHSPADLAITGPFRIAYASLLLVNALVWRPDLECWFGERGVLSLEASQALIHPARWTVFEFLPGGNETLWVCYNLFLAQVLCLLVGLFTRFQALCIFLWLVSFQNRNTLIFDGEDVLFRLFAFFLIFLPADRYLALDQRLFYKESPGLLPIWPLRLVQIEMTLLYYSTALEKCKGQDWQDGTALFYVSRMSDLYGRFPVPDFILGSLPALKLMTWTVLAVELFLPYGLWFRPTRKAALVLAVGLHLAIEYSMNLFLFQWIMLVGLLSFMCPEPYTTQVTDALGVAGAGLEVEGTGET